MSSDKFIIIVFGVIVIFWIINQKKEGFSFFDKIEQMVDIAKDNKNNIDYDLKTEMEQVFQQQPQYNQVIEQFQQDTLNGIEPTNLYLPSQFGQDTTKLKYLMEKDVNQVIKDMTLQQQPPTLKDTFNKSIINYKEINPQIHNSTDKININSKKSLDQNSFSYIENIQQQSQDDIVSYDKKLSNFSLF